MWLITEKTKNIKLDPDAFYVLTDDDVSLLEAQDYQYIPHFGLFMMINLDDGYEASANPAETCTKNVFTSSQQKNLQFTISTNLLQHGDGGQKK